VVCLVASAILLTLFYLLAGGTLFEAKAPLRLYIPDATGLGPGSPVRVNGVSVGKVTAVGFSGSRDPNRIIRVVMEVERDRLAGIPEDSTAQIGAETLIGDKFVDIDAGHSQRSVRRNGEIKPKVDTGVLHTLDLGQFEQQLRSMDSLVTDIEQGRGRVGEFIQGDQMYTDLQHRLDELLRGFRAAANTTSGVGRALYTDEAYQGLSAPLVALDRSLALMQSSPMMRDTAQYEGLRAQSVELRNSIAGLRANPWMAGDAEYAEWLGRVAGWIRQVEAIDANPLLSTSAAYESLSGAAQEMRDTLKEIREHPQRFLRLKVF
jgi:phospholipid/cholesterol/gamma-HCH transport system substrate-binding protein